MDYDKCGKGWWVGITRDAEVVAHHIFADKSYGGKKKALATAKEWRDRTEIIIWGKIRPYTYGQPFRDLLQVNNKSGKTGVFYGAGYFKKGSEYAYPFWAATWVDKHGSGIKRFYVHYFLSGKDAKDEAVRFRMGIEKKLKRGVKYDNKKDKKD